MRNELDDRLCRRFPVLYQDRRAPMTQTCMCWGFDCGDGWFEIIWQLSLAIESELNYSWIQKRMFLLKKRLSRRWNDLIYRLSPPAWDKTEMRGSGTDTDPYYHFVVEKATQDWLARLSRKLFPAQAARFDDFHTRRAWLCHLGLKSFVWHPYTGFAVTQVKEKYGTLRFYCPGTDAIYKYAALAEQLSAVTCELCGKPAKTKAVRGWYSTFCDDCRKKRN